MLSKNEENPLFLKPLPPEAEEGEGEAALRSGEEAEADIPGDPDRRLSSRLPEPPGSDTR